MTELYDGTTVGDIVICMDMGFEIARVLEISSKDYLNVKIQVIGNDKVKNVWGSSIYKLTEKTYNIYKNEFLLKLEQLEKGYKLSEQNSNTQHHN